MLLVALIFTHHSTQCVSSPMSFAIVPSICHAGTPLVSAVITFVRQVQLRCKKLLLRFPMPSAMCRLPLMQNWMSIHSQANYLFSSIVTIICLRRSPSFELLVVCGHILCVNVSMHRTPVQ